MAFRFHSPFDYRLQQLKKDVIHVLKKHPEGVLKSDIWRLVMRETGRTVKADDFGVSKLSRVFEKWTDEITITDLDNPRLILKDKSVYNIESKSGKDKRTPAIGLMAEIKRQTEKAGVKFPSTSETSKSNEVHVIEDENESEDEIVNDGERSSTECKYSKCYPVMREWVVNFFKEEGVTSCKMSKLRLYMKHKLKEQFGISKFKRSPCKTFLDENCKDIVYTEWTAKMDFVHLVQMKSDEIKDRKETKEKQEQPTTAMSLMTKISNLNKNQKSSPGANFISLLSDDKKSKNVEVIDLTNEPEQSVSKSQKNTLTSKFGSFPVPSNLLQRAHGGFKPVKLGECSESIKHRSETVASSPATNSMSGFGWESSHEGFQNKVIEIISIPINMTKFPQKRIDVRQVHVPYGRLPAREHVDGVAQECIDMLADANENVTMERVEKLVCQRFGCHNIRQIGFQYPDQIPCINELNRLLCKMNLYIITFVKSRSICTLYELKEAMREYAPGKGEFESLKVGPLQRFPLVYQQFHFPTDLAEIPEITTMDILDHFHNYLTECNLWSRKLELQPFMEYLSKQYEVNDCYMMGCKIRSLPLAAAVSFVSLLQIFMSIFLTLIIIMTSDCC